MNESNDTYLNDYHDDIDNDWNFSPSNHSQGTVLVVSQSNRPNVFEISTMVVDLVYTHQIQTDLVDTKMLRIHR